MAFQMSLFLAVFLLAIHAASAQNTFRARIRNNCANTLRVYVNGGDLGPLLPGGDLFRNLGLDTMVYTTLNGGNPDGSGTTRAVFWGEKFYYYFVKQPTTNVGLKISTNHPRSSDGLCSPIDCDPINCAGNAFGLKQTFATDAIPVSAAPPSPLRSCPFGSTEYTIEFCPNGTLPPGWERNGQEIQLIVQGDRVWCVDVRAASFTPGTPVQLYRCNGTPAQKWLVPSPAKSSGPIKLFGTNLCLDAGANIGRGARLTIQNCVANRASQTWSYDNTNGGYKFSIPGRGQCMDNTNGVMANSNPLQIWSCGGSINPNQAWLVSV